MDVLVDHKQGILHVTLNRPDKRNALTSKMCGDIVKAVQSAQERHDVGAILLCAAGQVFCAGMDLDEASEMHDDELAQLHEDLFTLGVNSLKPIVIYVNGPALGGGLGLVAQGHVVVAAQGAAFGLPEIRVGLWPFLVYRAVEAALGARRTLELSLSGRIVHGSDALQWGLAHYVCQPGEAAERAKTLARELAKASPAAVAAGMQYVHQSREKTWQQAGEIAKTLRAELMKSDDFKEGYEAFKQKREPHWRGVPK